MRIIAKAKPIRIRIKSGGEEHSSLDSLRQNLCVQDLWPLVKDKRLSRWLRQLGEVVLMLCLRVNLIFRHISKFWLSF